MSYLSIPYSRQEVTEEDIAAVVKVLRSEFLTQGTVLPAFEEAMAKRHQVEHAVAVGNATQALHIACLAMGIGPGSRVWTSPNSFVASANCALYCGATVDFVDIDPDSRNLSVAALRLKLEQAQQSGTLPDLLIPVDFAGWPCDLRELRELAGRYGFRILQDASHAVGAEYMGRPVGSAWADATVFSFHAVKVMTTAEGGMVTTQDAALARRLRLLRSHGITRDESEMSGELSGPWVYEQQTLGFNFRMTELQAALGLSQLARLDLMQCRREHLASRYDELLMGLPLKRPKRLTGRRPAWHLYTVQIDREVCGRSRRQVFDALRRAGVGTNVHYIPIHLQPYYRRMGFRPGDFPSAEAYYEGALTLPLFPSMTDADQVRVSSALQVALAESSVAN